MRCQKCGKKLVENLKAFVNGREGMESYAQGKEMAKAEIF